MSLPFVFLTNHTLLIKINKWEVNREQLHNWLEEEKKKKYPNILRNTVTCPKCNFVSISPVRTWTGDALRCDLTDEQTVTGTAHVLLPSWSILYGLRGERERVKGKMDGWMEIKNMKYEEDCVRERVGVDFIFEDQLLLKLSPTATYFTPLCFME